MVQIVKDLNIINPHTGLLLSKSAASRMINKGTGANRGRPRRLVPVEESQLAYSILLAARDGFAPMLFEIVATVSWYLAIFPARLKRLRNNQPTYQWVNQFLKRWKIKLHKACCTVPKRMRLSLYKLNVFFTNAKYLLLGNLPASHIINTDETQVPYDLTNKKWLKVREHSSLLLDVFKTCLARLPLSRSLFFSLFSEFFSFVVSSLVNKSVLQKSLVAASIRAQRTAFFPFLPTAPS